MVVRYLKGLFLWSMHLAAVPYLWARKQRLLRDHPIVGGVLAVPLTPTGEVVLVKLNYAKGWRFPGGGREAGENPEAAVLKELREEIGLTRHGVVERINDTDGSFLFVVRDVHYSAPSWSLEVRDVRAFSPHNVPSDVADETNRQLKMVRALLKLD